MRRKRIPWLAIAALAATACRTSGTAEPASPPSAPAASTPAASQPAEVRALPILPAPSQVEAAKPTGLAATGTRADRLEAAKAAYTAAMDAFYEPFRRAQTDEEREKLAHTMQRVDTKPYLEVGRKIVAEDPNDATAFDALTWMLALQPEKAEVERCIALLEQHHLESEKLADVAMLLRYSGSPRGRALLERAAKESPHRNVRGQALMALADAQQGDLSTSEELETMAEADRKDYLEYLGPEELDRLAKLDRAATERRAVELYETVVRDYADVESGHDGTIGEQARRALNEVQNLAVGKVAPDIKGEDLQSVAFHLSDYRGKVVLLDFWGNW